MESFARNEDTAEIIEVITDFGLGNSTGLIPLCCVMMAPTGFIERRRRRGNGGRPYNMVKRFRVVTLGSSSFDRGGSIIELNKTEPMVSNWTE